MSTFKKATKASARLRLTLIGPPGSGKTFSALSIATALGSRVAVIDTEYGSASKYAGAGPGQFSFDVLELNNFDPRNYISAIQVAEAEGYDVLIIDSLSHAWSGTGGALEMVNKEAARSRSNNTYFAWRDVTPVHNALIDAIIASRCHVITTMRTKYETVLETNDQGKVVPRIIGLEAVQRNGMEYEFDIVGDLDLNHAYRVTKTRYSALDGEVIVKPGKALGQRLLSWLTDTVPGTAEKPAVQSIDDVTIGRIRSAVQTLGMTDAQLLGALTRRGGVSSIERLSPSNADDLLRVLEAKVKTVVRQRVEIENQREIERRAREADNQATQEREVVAAQSIGQPEAATVIAPEPVVAADPIPATEPAPNLVTQAWADFQEDLAREKTEQAAEAEQAAADLAAAVNQDVTSDPTADDFVIPDLDRREAKDPAERKPRSRKPKTAATESANLL